MKTKSIGSTKKLSPRQAEKVRRQKELEFGKNPGRSSVGRSPMLGDYIGHYLKMRKREVQPGTLYLHRLTGEYLKAYFGEHRRLDSIQRPNARAFKAALAGGEITGVGRDKILGEWAIRQTCANSRKIFGMALEDDIIQANPFDKMAGKMPPAKSFYEVPENEISKLIEAANHEWGLLLAICYHSGLRRGEALDLRWGVIDWERSRLTVIANDEWRPKDSDSRIVPIVPELRSILLDAFERAEPGAVRVIFEGSIIGRDSHKPFTRLCVRAGVKPWRKPFQSLRKTRATTWSRVYPAHVVKEWMGHSDIKTTCQYYLQVSESEYDKAAGIGENQKPKMKSLS